LVLFGVAAALVLGECSLRVIGYAGDAERAQRVFDPRYGDVPRDSWIWHFQIDPARHRAVELAGQLIPLDKPSAEKRVLFVGDSATFGAFVQPEQSFPRVFQSLLDARDPEHHVRAINAGVWGMTTIDEYHLLQDKLLPLRPDVVVIGLFMANDLNMNLGHRERAAHATSVLGKLRSLSALVHYLTLTWHASQTWSPVRSNLVDARGLHMLSYPAGELATYVVPPSALIDHAYDVLRSVLSAFQRSGREHGFTLRVLLIPSPSRVLGRLAILHYPHLLQELAATSVSIVPADIDVDAPTRRVLALCQQLALACVDPTKRLQRLGVRAFFPTDEHPTAAAHEQLAQALLSD
jgi:lysophospholipase L1-like esterase